MMNTHKEEHFVGGLFLVPVSGVIVDNAEECADDPEMLFSATKAPGILDVGTQNLVKGGGLGS